MAPRDDLNNLLNYALEKAGEFIAETGHFDSFGAGMQHCSWRTPSKRLTAAVPIPQKSMRLSLSHCRKMPGPVSTRLCSVVLTAPSRSMRARRSTPLWSGLNTRPTSRCLSPCPTGRSRAHSNLANLAGRRLAKLSSSAHRPPNRQPPAHAAGRHASGSGFPRQRLERSRM